MNKTSRAALILIGLLPAIAVAGNADPVALANNLGFKGCDSLIRDSFSKSMNSENRYVSTAYFEETIKDSIMITTSYGVPGDSVMISSSFRPAIKQPVFCPEYDHS